MEIIGAEQKHYVLPGYRENREVIFGKNVRIGKNVGIIPPVILGNNVRLQDDTSVGPHTVVGNNVILDEKSEAENSIVFPNSYIGRGLQLSGKMVDGNRLISPGSSDIVKIEDIALISMLPEVSEISIDKIGSRVQQYFKKIWQIMKGKFFAITQSESGLTVNGRDSNAD